MEEAAAVVANPLADAVARLLDIGHPPVFKVVALPYCEPDKMLIMDPVGTDIVDVATEMKHPGLKIIGCPTAEARDQVIEQARELGLDLLEED